MNLRILFEKSRSWLKALSAFTKETLQLPNAKAYIALALGLSVFFFIITFPYDIIIRKQIKKIEHSIGRAVYIGPIEYSLIGDSYIDTIEIITSGGAEIFIKDMDFDVAVNPFTTILKKTLRGDCAIHDFRYVGDESSITGVLSGDFRLEFNDAGLLREGFVKFDMENVHLKGLNLKGFNIPAVQFTSIKADSMIKNNELKINSVVFSGADLNGTLSGTVLLSQFLGNSTINLQLEIDPNSRLVNDYRILLGNIGKEGENKIRISISGTLQDPKADFPWAAENRR
jgi:hypothetical protein